MLISKLLQWNVQRRLDFLAGEPCIWSEMESFVSVPKNSLKNKIICDNKPKIKPVSHTQLSDEAGF